MIVKLKCTQLNKKKKDGLGWERMGRDFTIILRAVRDVQMKDDLV